MHKLPIYLGYAGLIPFIFFFLSTFFIQDETHKQIITFLQLSYSTMILSFLGGVHWGQAIPRNHYRQMLFAMVPTVVCIFLMFWTFAIGAIFPLFALAVLFWVVYKADKKYMPLDHIPEGYFVYRLRLTVVVSTTLFLSALLMLSV